MPFKKLIEPLKEALSRKGFETPLPFQKQILSKIKGGANVFGIAPEGAGKTTALILSVIQKLKGEAIDDAPRALIFVKDKKAALDLALEFNAYTRGTDLRVYCAYDEHNIELQREEIYLGTDIVIATPKRLNKIFYLNGIHLGQLKICIVEDAEFLFKGRIFGEISRTPESIEKCQYVVLSTKYDTRFERWRETFMNNSQIVKLSI
ncbi:DEAD/DEAH box helicase [Flavobacteriales bacterium 34_180_T64]|nr:DEAD/DEAH box helicase [Flavobacteriales bacterium 34_180_T64]